MQPTALLTLLATLAVAVPHGHKNKRDAVIPVVKGEPTVIGLLADASLNRDSCGSSKFGSRALWVCRDSQPYDANGIPILPLFSSSASWTDPGSLTMYGDNAGKSFYPLEDDHCNGNEAGVCDDGTRYPVWADSPPLVTSDDGQTVVAYTWIRNSHIQGLEDLVPNPATTLYRVTYSAGDEGLPGVAIVDAPFWGENEIPFGVYGNVVRDGMAYLWGKSNGQISLARVPVTDVEDRSRYEFYVNSTWTTTKPALGDAGATIPNASAGGQGTYYYSEQWQSYVWIGQAGISVSADFFITTASAPEGPWIQPFQFYSGVNGNFSLGAYSLQANPALSEGNEIYLTYTKTDAVGDNVALYTTPLIRVEWE